MFAASRVEAASVLRSNVMSSPHFAEGDVFLAFELLGERGAERDPPATRTRTRARPSILIIVEQ